MEVSVDLSIFFNVFYLILFMICSIVLCSILFCLVTFKSSQADIIKKLENSHKEIRASNDSILDVKRSIIEEKERQLFKNQIIDELTFKFQKEIDDLKQQQQLERQKHIKKSSATIINDDESKIENLDELIINDLSKKLQIDFRDQNKKKVTIDDENEIIPRIDEQVLDEAAIKLENELQLLRSQHSKLIKELTVTYPTESQNKFAFKIFKYFSEKNKGENIFISPLSISSALSIVLNGSDSENEIKELLEMNHLRREDILVANKRYLNFLADVKTEDSLLIDLKNRLLIEKNLKIDDYLKVELDDFFNCKSDSFDSIENVNDLITDPKNHINPTDHIVLMNTFSFKAKLLHYARLSDFIFKRETIDSNEFESFGIIESVKTIKNLNHAYFRDLKLKACQLQYNKGFLMTIILPYKGASIEDIEKNLDLNVLNNIFSNMEPSGFLSLILPKFKVQSEYELSEYLESLGLKSELSKIIHKTEFELNEEYIFHQDSSSQDIGTVAATSKSKFKSKDGSGSNKLNQSASVVDGTKPLDFTCDKEFIFMIHEKEHNVIVFMGKFMKPKEWLFKPVKF